MTRARPRRSSNAAWSASAGVRAGERLRQDVRVVGQQCEGHRRRAQPGREGEQRERGRVGVGQPVPREIPDRLPRRRGARQRVEDGVGVRVRVGEHRRGRVHRQRQVVQARRDPVRGLCGQVGAPGAQQRHRLGAGERRHGHRAGLFLPSRIRRGDQHVAGTVRQVPRQLPRAGGVVEDQQPPVPPRQRLEQRRGRPLRRVRGRGQVEGLRELGQPVRHQVGVPRGDPPGDVVAVAMPVREVEHRGGRPQPLDVGVGPQPHRAATLHRGRHLRPHRRAVDEVAGQRRDAPDRPDHRAGSPRRPPACGPARPHRRRGPPR